MKPNRCKAHNRTLSLLSLASPHSSSTTPSSRSICLLAQRSSPWINSDLDGLFQSCSQLQCLVLGGSLTRHTVHSIWICDGGAVERKAPSLLCSGACMFRGHNTARESGCNSSCHTKFRRRMDQFMDPTRFHSSTPRHAPLHAPLKHKTKYSRAPISIGAIGECRPIINHSGISDRSREQHEANLSPVGVYKLTPITAALGPDSAPFHNHTHSAALHICIDIMFEIDWTTVRVSTRRLKDSRAR